MRKITFLSILCFVFSVLQATEIFRETFQTTETNFNNYTLWTPTGANDTKFREIISTPLTYVSSNGKEYCMSNVGKAVKSFFSGYPATYHNQRAFINNEVISSGVLYMSLLFAIPPGAPTVSDGIGVVGLANGTTQYGQLIIRRGTGATSAEVGPKYKFCCTRNTSSKLTAAGLDISAQSDFERAAEGAAPLVHLIVIKFDFATSTSSLFIDPAVGGAEPTPIFTDAATGTMPTSLNGVDFRAASSSSDQNNYIVSGLRVTTTWAEAVAEKSISTVIQNKLNPKILSTANGFKVIGATVQGTIYNLLGTETQLKVTDTNINTASLQKGAYIMVLNVDGETIKHKFLK